MMGKPRKLNKIDRLSDLPDTIIHHILSFLNIKDVARISTLSSRCRSVCLSSPFLTIDLCVSDDLNKFEQFLNRFLSLRNWFSIRLFKLTMFSSKCDLDGFNIGSWLLEATRCNVEKIDLHFCGFHLSTLPSGVLKCASLRDLKVDLSNKGTLKLPTTFGRLENLTLQRLNVSIRNFGEWISNFKSLRSLCLVEVCGMHDLSVSSSSLERLIIKHIGVSIDRPDKDGFCIKVSAERLSHLEIRLEFDYYRPHLLTLHAPKLEQFLWDGDVSHYSCGGNFECLSFSELAILPASCWDGERWTWIFADGIVGKILQTIYRVSSICVYDFFIQAMISTHELLPEFCNLHSLTVIRTDFDVGKGDKTPHIVSVLHSIPHLSTLKIHRWWDDLRENEMSYSSEYWQSQDLKFVRTLEEVEMQIEGNMNEMELIKYLLKNAKALKKMTIFYPDKLNGRSVITRKIQQFQVASSSFALYFLPK